MTRSLVVLSGGQDSTICLAWALRLFDRVEALSFDYGQRHRVELESAGAIAKATSVPHIVVPVPGLTGSSLTDHSAPVLPSGGLLNLPSTFTPGRNAVFLALAAGRAAASGIHDLVTGICQTDFSGYPDCRDDFRASMEATMRLALGGFPLRIHAPLMHLTKAESVALAARLDALPLLALSHTCYLGRRPACGECPACVLRLRGFQEAGIEDPIPYSHNESRPA